MVLVEMHSGLQILLTPIEMVLFALPHWTYPSQMTTLCIFIATYSTEQRDERVNFAS